MPSKHSGLSVGCRPRERLPTLHVCESPEEISVKAISIRKQQNENQKLKYQQRTRSSSGAKTSDDQSRRVSRNLGSSWDEGAAFPPQAALAAQISA